VVLFDPGLNVMPSMSIVDLPTLAGDVAYTNCFQAVVILERLKEGDELLKQEAFSFHIMFG